MKAPLSASQSVNQNHLFSKTADRTFIKFHTNFWILKDKKVMQPGKSLIFGKKPETSLEVGLFGVGKKFVLLMSYFWVYMMHHSCLYDSAKIACFGKISFSSNIQKCSFLCFNITKTIWTISRLDIFWNFNISENCLR